MNIRQYCCSVLLLLFVGFSLWAQEPTILWRKGGTAHDYYNGVSLSGDGSKLYYVNYSTSSAFFHLFGTQTPGQILRSFDGALPRKDGEPGGEGWSQPCALSTDGKWLASGFRGFSMQQGGLGAKLRLWNAETGEAVWTVDMSHFGTLDNSPLVYGLVFAPDAQTFAGYVELMDDKSFVGVFSRATGTLLDSFHLSFSVQNIVFSPDNQYLFISSYRFGSEVEMIELATRKRLWKSNDGGSRRVDISPDSKYSLSVAGGITVREIATGKKIQTYAEELYPVGDAQFLPDGSILMAVALGDVKIWNWQTNTIVRTFPTNSTSFQPFFDLSGNGALMALGDEHTIELWDVEQGKKIRDLAAIYGQVHEVQFSSEQPYFLDVNPGGFQAGYVNLWKIPEGQQKLQLRCENLWYGQTAHFSNDGAWVVVAQHDTTIQVWDIETAQPVYTFQRPPGYCVVALSPDKRYVAAWCSDSTLRVWDVQLQQLVLSRRAARKPYEIKRLRFLPNTNKLIFFDEEMGWIDLDTKEEKKFASIWVADDFAVSPSTPYVAGMDGGDITIWRTDKIYQQEHTLLNTDSYTTALDFFPDGRHIVSVNSDSTLRLWNVETEQNVLTLHLPIRATRVAVSPNGTYIATSTQDVSIALWKVPSVYTTVLEQVYSNQAISSAPNPFSTETTIQFTVNDPLPTEALVEIVDCNGRSVQTLLHKTVLPGEHAVSFVPRQFLASGTYYCRVTLNGILVSTSTIIKE